MKSAILGGGALGLLAAYRLAQAGQSVTVFEQEPVAGGLAAGFRIGDNWLEKFYHHIFRSDTMIIRVIEELGLGERLEWLRPRTVSLVGGQIHQLDSPLSLLRFQPWRIDERLRVGATLAYLKVAPAQWLENKTAAPWLQKWMGKRPYEMIFESVLQGKFGDLYGQIALPWFQARIRDRSTQLGYLRGGFQLFYERLVERISQLGGTVLLGTRVEQIIQHKHVWNLITRNLTPIPDLSISRDLILSRPFRSSMSNISIPSSVPDSTLETSSWEFDRVISTLPMRLTCRLIPALPDDYRAQYDWGQAYGAHCLILALDRQLTDSYWVNICDRGYPFVGLFEHTNFRAPEEYGGRHLVYLGNYRPMDDPLFKMSKDEVMAEFLPHLRRIVPAFKEAWVQESWMFKAPFAQPIVTTDYRQHIAPFQTPLAGLWVANMFQVYPHDRGQNYSLELAQRVARTVLQSSDRCPPNSAG